MVISRDTAILPRKLDWMVTDRADDLKTIMSDNATFIQFPALGSSTSLITVYGDHRVNIQRTIRSIMQLVSCSRLLAVTKLTHIYRLVNTMSGHFGSYQFNLMHYYRLKLSAPRPLRRCSSKFRLRLEPRSYSKACVSRCMV